MSLKNLSFRANFPVNRTESLLSDMSTLNAVHVIDECIAP